MPKTTRFLAALSVLTLGLFAGGCASTAPTAKFARELPAENRIAANDEFTVEVKATGEAKLLDYEKSRFAEILKNAITSASIANPAKPTPHKVVVELTLTRYEKGNAFARAVLAGLGQIHVDGKVRLLQADTQAVIAEFDIKKTFAWGGLYGATVSMEDIEKSFSHGVAAAVTGQKEKEGK